MAEDDIILKVKNECLWVASIELVNSDSDVDGFKKTCKKKYLYAYDFFYKKRQIDRCTAYCRNILHKKQKTSTSNTEIVLRFFSFITLS